MITLKMPEKIGHNTLKGIIQDHPALMPQLTPISLPFVEPMEVGVKTLQAAVEFIGKIMEQGFDVVIMSGSDSERFGYDYVVKATNYFEELAQNGDPVEIFFVVR